MFRDIGIRLGPARVIADALPSERRYRFRCKVAPATAAFSTAPIAIFRDIEIALAPAQLVTDGSVECVTIWSPNFPEPGIAAPGLHLFVVEGGAQQAVALDCRTIVAGDSLRIRFTIVGRHLARFYVQFVLGLGDYQIQKSSDERKGGVHLSDCIFSEKEGGLD